MVKLKAAEYESFEAIKQTDENGNEFRFAQDLLKIIDNKLEESINSRTLTEEEVIYRLEKLGIALHEAADNSIPEE